MEDRHLLSVGGYSDALAESNDPHDAGSVISLSGEASAGPVLEGTSEDDVFEFVGGPAGSWIVKVNGARHYFGPEVNAITFDGLAGHDTVTLAGTRGDDTVTLRPDRGTLTGDGYAVDVINVEAVTVSSGRGDDKAELYGSATSLDTFIGRPAYALLSDGDYSHRVDDFAQVTVHAAGPQTDVARLLADGGDTFYAGSTSAVGTLMSGTTTSGRPFSNVAEGFREVYGYSTEGGGDRAYLYDSADQLDVFFAKPGYAYLRGGGFFTRVTNFDQVVGTATAGGTHQDVARLTASVGDDLLEAAPEEATLKFNGNDSTSIQASGFCQVHAYGSKDPSDGLDRANLSGSALSRDMFGARPGLVLHHGSEFDHKLTGFEQVIATSTPGDQDVARLADSTGDDVLEASPEEATLKFHGSEENFVKVSHFREVLGYASDGLDVARLVDSAATKEVFRAGPDVARLFNNDFLNRLVGFEQVSVTATAGGGDEATLAGSPGTDVFAFDGELQEATLKFHGNEGTFVRASDFWIVRASASKAHVDDSHGNDIFVTTDRDAVLRSPGAYCVRASCFEGIVEASPKDDYDRAYLFESSPWRAIGDWESTLDVHEENDSFSQATGLHDVSGAVAMRDVLAIHEAGGHADPDYFKFTTRGEGTSSDYVEIQFAHADGNLDMELYDAGQNWVASSTSVTDNERISLEGRAAGAYYLRVYGYADATNRYDLLIAAPEARTWLIRDGQPAATIVRGAEDDFAAERLQQWLAEQQGVQIDIRLADQTPLPDEGCVVLVGSAASNPAIRDMADQLGLALDPAELTDQGYVALGVQHGGRDWLILAGGGRDGAIYAVVDLLNSYLGCAEGDVWFEPFETRQIPESAYRWLWTWDNRMDWGGDGTAVDRMGGGAYEKDPEAYLADYKRCVDYLVDHKFNGLIIWGFLRDSHGGVEAAEELCRYAARRGVRILPGVGTSGYGGYYYEGEHPFNVATWLEEHPELRAIDESGQPHPALCPSKQANQDWLDRGAEWLFENFEIGGANLEMGDFFVCHCDDCKQARAAMPSDDPDYYKDMAVSHSVTLDTMRRLAPEAWLSYGTYTGYTAEMMVSPPGFLSMIPEDAICLWTLTRMSYEWPVGIRPMAEHNLGYLHWCNRSNGTEGEFYLERIQAICRQAAVAGFEGLSTYGELSDEYLNVEIFYLAWEAFLWDPEMTIEQFVDQRLAPLYGGSEAARVVVEIIPLVRTKENRESLENCIKARQMAESAREVASPGGHESWDRMIALLRSYEDAALEALQVPV